MLFVPPEITPAAIPEIQSFTPPNLVSIFKGVSSEDRMIYYFDSPIEEQFLPNEKASLTNFKKWCKSEQPDEELP